MVLKYAEGSEPCQYMSPIIITCYKSIAANMIIHIKDCLITWGSSLFSIWSHLSFLNINKAEGKSIIGEIIRNLFDVCCLFVCLFVFPALAIAPYPTMCVANIRCQDCTDYIDCTHYRVDTILPLGK